MQQGTEEWRAARLGKLTASRIADAIAKTKSGWGASRANIKALLIAERLTGIPQETYVSAAMQHGTDTEPQARIAYEFLTDQAVTQVGFVGHPSIPGAGASPDGLVGDDGLIEIKCPGTATHIDNLLGSKISERYMTQMQFQLACTGRKWCDFVSFDARLPTKMQLKIQRVYRDDTRIALLESQARDFLAEIEETIAALDKMVA